MPIYEYQCNDCGRTTELLQRLSDPPLASCPDCGGTVKKLFSAPAVQFKGTGWYVTDYAGKGKQAPAGKSAEDGGKKAAKSDKSSGDGASAKTKKSEAKSAGGKE